MGAERRHGRHGRQGRHRVRQHGLHEREGRRGRRAGDQEVERGAELALPDDDRGHERGRQRELERAEPPRESQRGERAQAAEVRVGRAEAAPHGHREDVDEDPRPQDVDDGAPDQSELQRDLLAWLERGERLEDVELHRDGEEQRGEEAEEERPDEGHAARSVPCGYPRMGASAWNS